MEKEQLVFESPMSGDCVNAHDGEVKGEKLGLPVIVRSAKGRQILLNGVSMQETEEGRYLGAVEAAGGKNTLTACDAESGEQCEIAVYYLPNALGKYRISVDDNLLFLQDLTLRAECYPSAFDHPYLAIYKQAHERYGAVVQLNLFYATNKEALSHFASGRAYFDLSMMTDRYKEEFSSNADWLSFSFHAYSEFPSRPYRISAGEEILADCERVHREIIRFAGEACLSKSATVHWGEPSKACIKALRCLGYRSLMGFFERNGKGEAMVSYHLPDAVVDRIGARDFWFDATTDLLYGRIDLILNARTAAENLQLVYEITADAGRGGFVSLMIHEQYFYEDYDRYLSDFAARILEPCRYLAENGYVGAQVWDAADCLESCLTNASK